jgi:hypothetical protein
MADQKTPQEPEPPKPLDNPPLQPAPRPNADLRNPLPFNERPLDRPSDDSMVRMVE